MIREHRYLTFKLSDIREALSEDERASLEALGRKVDHWRETQGKSPFRAAVVEHDWPEYEPVWNAIAQRVSRDRDASGQSDL
jgi:hypothetical protein